jgi:ribonuclease P protein component
MRATFKKSERICSKRIIDRIFAGGSKSFAVYPLRAVFQMVERPAGSPPVMVLFR